MKPFFGSPSHYQSKLLQLRTDITDTSQAVQQGPAGTKGGVLHVTPPDTTSPPCRSNDHILEYGVKHEVRGPTPLAHPRRHRDELPAVQAVSEMIQETNATITFVWLSSKPDIQLPYFSYTPLIANKFQKTSFCSKVIAIYSK